MYDLYVPEASKQQTAPRETFISDFTHSGLYTREVHMQSSLYTCKGTTLQLPHFLPLNLRLRKLPDQTQTQCSWHSRQAGKAKEVQMQKKETLSPCKIPGSREPQLIRYEVSVHKPSN